VPRDASGSASTEERAKAASVVAAPAVTSHIVPEANALEAAVVQGLRVHPARHFGEVVAWMRGTTESPTRLPQAALASDASVLDLADVGSTALLGEGGAMRGSDPALRHCSERRKRARGSRFRREAQERGYLLAPGRLVLPGVRLHGRGGGGTARASDAASCPA
jgi:hypothetical protein